MYSIYILYSKRASRYYIGCSTNPEARLYEHNKGRVRSTRAYRPWNIVYTETYKTKKVAYKRERVIKAYKSGVAFSQVT